MCLLFAYQKTYITTNNHEIFKILSIKKCTYTENIYFASIVYKILRLLKEKVFCTVT